MKLGIYRHYKGGLYEVIDTARHSETLEELVVYRALYTDDAYGNQALWVRPKTMFLETVIINGTNTQRFVLVETPQEKS